MSVNKQINSKNIALMAIMAAIYVILSILPGITVAPNVAIQFEAGFASVMGFVLGPCFGFLSALIASSTSWLILSSGIFGLPFLFNPPINAFIVGIIVFKTKKESITIGSLLFTVLILIELFLPPLWPLSENWIVALAVLWDKLIGLALIFPTVWLYSKNKHIILQEGHRKLIAFGIFLSISLIGNILDNLLGVVIFSLPPIYEGVYALTIDTVRFLFLANPFIYLPIRIAQSVFASLIIVGLLKFAINELQYKQILKE
ncbi:MAG: ECF transporter S component [Candidatus Odinarchaeia archaeon]